LFPVRARNRHHEFKEIEFQVDSAANVTTIPIATAEAKRLPIPTNVIELEARTAVGKVRQRVHAGRLTVRVPGLVGREFVWPCHFVEAQGEPPPALLGLAGVLDDLRIPFDGTYALEAPYGWLVLEERVAAEPA
jgi:hypothetical protein